MQLRTVVSLLVAISCIVFYHDYTHLNCMLHMQQLQVVHFENGSQGRAGHAGSALSLVSQSAPRSWPSVDFLRVLINAWANTLRHDCGIHIAHVHKNVCGSRDFAYQALLFLLRPSCPSLVPPIILIYIERTDKNKKNKSLGTRLP